jgi:hypothetical protein
LEDAMPRSCTGRPVTVTDDHADTGVFRIAAGVWLPVPCHPRNEVKVTTVNCAVSNPRL